MGSMLETIKKGMSALNPLGTSVGKKKSKIVPKEGYLGDTTKKAVKHNKAVADAMKE